MPTLLTNIRITDLNVNTAQRISKNKMHFTSMKVVMQNTDLFVTCTKLFQFSGLLTEHIRTHTKKDLIPCTNCKKRFTTNRNMFEHQKTHQNLSFVCPTCGYSFNTKPHMDQHFKGAHEPGWKTPCGASEQWPRKVQSHEDVTSVKLSYGNILL